MKNFSETFNILNLTKTTSELNVTSIQDMLEAIRTYTFTILIQLTMTSNRNESVNVFTLNLRDVSISLVYVNNRLMFTSNDKEVILFSLLEVSGTTLNQSLTLGLEFSDQFYVKVYENCCFKTELQVSRSDFSSDNDIHLDMHEENDNSIVVSNANSNDKDNDDGNDNLWESRKCIMRLDYLYIEYFTQYSALSYFKEKRYINIFYYYYLYFRINCWNLNDENVP